VDAHGTIEYSSAARRLAIRPPTRLGVARSARAREALRSVR